jgi:hypothetical protein
MEYVVDTAYLYKVKDDEMDRLYSTNGEKTNACRILLGKPEGNIPLGKPKRGWGQ